jgi:hypothetical protein
MRVMAAAIAALCVFVPCVATGQSSRSASMSDDTEGQRRPQFSLQVAAGPTLVDRATTVSAAAGYAPARWLEVLVNVERIDAPMQTTQYPDGYSISRGGTLTFVSGEVRFAPLPEARVSPFAMAGVGRGISRPTVNAEFPEPVKNDLQVLYFGGGARVPLRRGVSLLADARAMLALEGYDSVLGIWSVRGGIAWRF